MTRAPFEIGPGNLYVLPDDEFPCLFPAYPDGPPVTIAEYRAIMRRLYDPMSEPDPIPVTPHGDPYGPRVSLRWPSSELELAYQNLNALRTEAMARALEKKSKLEEHVTATALSDLPKAMDALYAEWKAEDRMLSEQIADLMMLAIPVYSISEAEARRARLGSEGLYDAPVFEPSDGAEPDAPGYWDKRRGRLTMPDGTVHDGVFTVDLMNGVFRMEGSDENGR